MRDWKGVPAVSWVMVGFAVVMSGTIAYLAVQGKLSSEVTGALISALIAVVVTHLAHVSGQALAYRRMLDEYDAVAPAVDVAPVTALPAAAASSSGSSASSAASSTDPDAAADPDPDVADPPAAKDPGTGRRSRSRDTTAV